MGSRGVLTLFVVTVVRLGVATEEEAVHGMTESCGEEAGQWLKDLIRTALSAPIPGEM